jgi:hypothetical protein
MSAFLCSPKHIALIATWAADRGLVKDRSATARLLAEENIRSVAHRYPHRAENLVEQWLDMTEEAYLTACMRTRVEGYAPAQVNNLAKSLDYQSCEHPGWEASEAKRIVDRVIADTSGYPQALYAPWGI